MSGRPAIGSLRLPAIIVLALFAGCNQQAAMDTHHPIVHEPEFEGIPSATEYSLPHPTISDDVFATLHPWMQKIATADLPQVRTLLLERFAGIEEPELQPLRDQLLSYTPVSIMVCNSRAWLTLTSGQGSDTIGSSTFLPPPEDVEQLPRRLAEAGIADNRLLFSFIRHFSGLSEDVLTAGRFLESTEEWTAFTSDWPVASEANAEPWLNSLVIYHARNGDQLLLRPSGQVGWYKLGEARITENFTSFAEFLSFFVKLRQRTPWPLDSYGPPDERNR